MKTTFFSVRNFMIGMGMVCSAVFFIGCKDDEAPVNNNPYTISGNSNGSQVVPSVTDTATGAISGSYAPATKLLTYTASWKGLSGAPVAGGFYTGASGVNGSLNGAAWSFDSTATATGSRSDTLTLTAEQATQLLNGNWYYTVTTAAHPAGEIRGQITAVR